MSFGCGAQLAFYHYCLDGLHSMKEKVNTTTEGWKEAQRWENLKKGRGKKIEEETRYKWKRKNQQMDV